MSRFIVTLFASIFWTVAVHAGPIFSETAKVELLWSEGEFTEGTTLGPDGCIYFSDIGNRILRFDPKTKKTSIFRDPSHRSNGLKFDSAGSLIACEGANTDGGRRISRTSLDGKIETLAQSWEGKRFNSPNDLAISPTGEIYFTDPRYVGTEPRELKSEPIFRVTSQGEVSLFDDRLKKPNGIVFSPDGKLLFVAETDPKGNHHLVRFNINKDGSAGDFKVLHDFGKGRGIDGMAMTENGFVVTTTGSGTEAAIVVFDANGKKIDSILVPEDPANCCFGGDDLRTLYIAAGKSLYRVATKAKGVKPPFQK
jgi:gluconolactonase